MVGPGCPIRDLTRIICASSIYAYSLLPIPPKPEPVNNNKNINRNYSNNKNNSTNKSNNSNNSNLGIMMVIIVGPCAQRIKAAVLRN